MSNLRRRAAAPGDNYDDLTVPQLRDLLDEKKAELKRRTGETLEGGEEPSADPISTWHISNGPPVFAAIVVLAILGLPYAAYKLVDHVGHADHHWWSNSH